ncbi:MAG: cytochrome c biogenesis protein CcdA [Candidatus Omnitrophota bacterium]
MTLQGNIFDYFIVFFGGILTSFSPCMYPLLPAMVAYILPKSTSRKKGFILSLFYVLGLSITYSILGLIASLSGQLFGRLTTKPIFYLIVANIYIILGLVLLDVFELPMPHFFKAKNVEPKGYWSTLIFGMISGLMIGPCITPILASVLIYVSTKQNIIFGSTLLFAFSFGMGFLFILLGAFGGALLSFPKSGEWLLKIKKICGIILILAGEYFLFKAGRLSI